MKDDKRNRKILLIIIILILFLFGSFISYKLVSDRKVIDNNNEVEEVVNNNTINESIIDDSIKEDNEIDVVNEDNNKKEEKYYKVTFINKDGKLIKYYSVKEGDMPSFSGTIPSYYDGIYNYRFIGWDKKFSPVLKDIIYTALYEVIDIIDDSNQNEINSPDTNDTPESNPTDIDYFYIKNTGSNVGQIEIIDMTNSVARASCIPDALYSAPGIGNQIEPLKNANAPELHLQYSLDKINWIDFNSYAKYDSLSAYLKVMLKGMGGDAASAADYITVQTDLIHSDTPLLIEPNQTIYLKAKDGYDNECFGKTITNPISVFMQNQFYMKGQTSDTTFSLGGNLLSLLDDGYGTSNANVNSLNDRSFSFLFANFSDKLLREIGSIESGDSNISTFDLNTTTSITSISDMSLPSFTSKGCYSFMFYYCSGLTDVIPSMPTNLSNECFRLMYSHASNITSLPEGLLNATTLADYCYFGMFDSCTSLTTVPENLLPATTLKKSCYDQMFIRSGISSSSLPNLPANNLAQLCYSRMYAYCPNITNVDPNYLPATSGEGYCYNEMFAGSNITSVPKIQFINEIPSYACDRMFLNCSNLTSVPNDMFLDSLQTVNDYGCREMFSETAIIQAPKLPAINIGEAAYRSMFKGCTQLESASDIYANSFRQISLSEMFFGCTKLKNITFKNSFDLTDPSHSSLNINENFVNDTDSLVDGAKRQLHIASGTTLNYTFNYYLNSAYWDVVTD